MKKSLLALSGLAVLFICSSVSAIAAPPAAYPQYSSSAVLLADAAKTAAKDEAKSKEEAPKPVLTPVKVSVSVSALNVEIDIAGKPATLGSYNPNQQKRTITISQATLAGPEQKNEIDKGLIKSVQVREIDGNKVVIDIYALGNPRIIQQAYGKKFLVSLSDMEETAKPKAKPAAAKPQAKAASAASPEAGSKTKAASAAPKTQAKAAPAASPEAGGKAKAASAAPKPQAKAAPAVSPEAGGKDKAAAAKKETAKPAAAAGAKSSGQEADTEEKAAAPAAVPEPIPVTVKVNNSADSVSFDVNWSGDVKVKEFPYNPSKGMHTFVFSPAVLSAPEGLVAVSQGTLQAIRTRQLDKQTVAVDIMASSAPNVKAQNRQTPGASYTIRAAKAAAAVPKTPKTGTSAAAPVSAKSTGEAKQPVTSSQASSKAGSTQPAAAAPAPIPAGQTEPQKAPVPSASAVNSSQVPAAAPKAASNVGAESNTSAGQSSSLSDSERVCDYFTMAGRDVQSLVNSMKGLFPNVRFQADPVLSVILVEGPAKDIEEVRKLINIQ